MQRLRGCGFRASAPRLILVSVCLGAGLASAGCGGDGDGSTPTLVEVLDGPCTAPGSSPHPILPARTVRLRVGSAWPSATLVVTGNGTELENVGPSNTQRQSDLKAAGMPFWVPANIDPDTSPPTWTVQVELPESMKDGPLALTFVSREPDGTSSSALSENFTPGRLTATAPAYDRVDLSWRERGGAAGYRIIRTRPGSLLPGSLFPYRQFDVGPDKTTYQDKSGITDKRTYTYRVTAYGCPNSSPGTDPILGPADVTPPVGPQNGVETIALSRSLSDPFLFEVDLLLFAPRWDAVVASVTNVAVDVNNEKKVPLGRIRHTDTANNVSRSENPSGTGCPEAITLNPDDSTSKFDGMTVTGKWEAKVVCISNAFLRDLIELKIAWRAPH